MRIHELKCWPDFFSAILDGRKTFEARLDDRGFEEGDVLMLREYRSRHTSPNPGYTGREAMRSVSYILEGPGFGVEDGYVIMALAPVEEARNA